MPTWDRRTPQQQAKVRDAALRRQLRDAVGPFSPFWRERFAALRVPASSIETASDLTKLPAVGERDVCPTGDPADAARLVLQADEAGFALHAFGPDLRKALVHRLTGAERYRRAVEAETRPTTYHFAGRGLRYPIASTRNDLDVVARAGARAWSVLGLTAADVLVSAVPVAASLDHLFLTYAALAAGAPALFPGPERLAETLRLVPATVVAVRPEEAAELLAATDLGGVTTVLLVGAASAGVRDAVAAAAPGATVLGLWGPDEGRLLWAQCREGGAAAGWHTYPDLDLVELLDPETGNAATRRGGEVALTQLGLRGTALLRWRTGDVVASDIDSAPCPSCGRTVPRLPSDVRTSHLHVRVSLRHTDADEPLDLRAVAGALAGRTDLADWMVEVGPSPREHETDLVVLIAPNGDETDAAVGVYRDVRAVAGMPPSQVVVVTAEELAARRPPEDTATPRVVVRR